jgi:KH domain
MQVPYLHHMPAFSLFRDCLRQGDEVHSLVNAKLRAMNIQVVPRSQPVRPLSPLITPVPLRKTPWISWGQSRRFDLEDREEYTLSLRGGTEQLDEAYNVLAQAVWKVSAASYMGRLEFTAHLPDFGHLIGTNGDTVRRLENETNTTIRVDSPRVKIIG